MKRPGVTLQLLWIEYKQRYPEGWQYTQPNPCEAFGRQVVDEVADHRGIDLAMRAVPMYGMAKRVTAVTTRREAQQLQR